MSNSGVHIECLVRGIPPMESGCSASFEDGPALGIGMGFFDSSLILLEWTHLTAGLGGKGPLLETEMKYNACIY